MSDLTIILCAGPINYTHLPIGTNTSNALIPINGKPVIGHILDDLLRKGICENVTVVLRRMDVRLKNFLKRVYVNRIDLHIAELHEAGTIVQSLQAGLSSIEADDRVRVILGDTLISDSYHCDQEFFYIGKVENAARWCLAVIDKNDHIQGFIDKQDLEGGPFNALAGYYHFTHADTLRNCVEESVSNGEKELSDVFRRYITNYPITAKVTPNWFDFGHIENLVKAKRHLLHPRFFNNLVINPVLNTITKTSKDNETLQDELDWYLTVPEELSVLMPRLVSYEKSSGNIKIVEEYYGYPTLAELFVFGELKTDAWSAILHQVLLVHGEFRRFSGHIDAEDAKQMYIEKTQVRLDQAVKQDQRLRDLILADSFIYNGRLTKNLPDLQEPLKLFIGKMVENLSPCIIHGDFCFSNILFDVSNQILRLIDPRGRFGKKGIYGDPRYDIAKLSHSAHGMYDFIMADIFSVEKIDGEYTGVIFSDPIHTAIGNIFDRYVSEVGYDLKEIWLLEGLLFVSMVPIHYGQIERQLMMYLTGVSILNEVLT